MAGLRNLLIHEYGIIDTAKLYGHLDQLSDLKEIVGEIKGYLGLKN